MLHYFIYILWPFHVSRKEHNRLGKRKLLLFLYPMQVFSTLFYSFKLMCCDIRSFGVSYITTHITHITTCVHNCPILVLTYHFLLVFWMVLFKFFPTEFSKHPLLLFSEQCHNLNNTKWAYFIDIRPTSFLKPFYKSYDKVSEFCHS
jgi:hypothetical protein